MGSYDTTPAVLEYVQPAGISMFIQFVLYDRMITYLVPHPLSMTVTCQPAAGIYIF